MNKETKGNERKRKETKGLGNERTRKRKDSETKGNERKRKETKLGKETKLYERWKKKLLFYVFNPLFVVKIPETRYTKCAVTVCFFDPSFFGFGRNHYI